MDKSIVPVDQIASRSSTRRAFSNSNGAEVAEIEDDPVKTVERQMEDLKLNHQFNEKDVPQIFKTLINNRMNGIKNIQLRWYGSDCMLQFDDFPIRFEKDGDNCTVKYEKVNKTIKTVDPEKSIVDHLWFVLKHLNIRLEELSTSVCNDSTTVNRRQPDLKKLAALLQSMFDSINHQIQTTNISCEGFNEDTTLSMLKHVEPGTLEEIIVRIFWKEKENYQKMEEIVGTDQWKQANSISSFEITPLKIDDLSRCEFFWLELDSITPEDVLRVTKDIFNSVGIKSRTLSCKKKKYDIDAIIDFLRSQIDGSQFTKVMPAYPDNKFRYIIVKSGKRAFMSGSENIFAIQNL